MSQIFDKATLTTFFTVTAPANPTFDGEILPAYGNRPTPNFAKPANIRGRGKTFELAALALTFSSQRADFLKTFLI